MEPVIVHPNTDSAARFVATPALAASPMGRWLPPVRPIQGGCRPNLGRMGGY